MNFFTILSIFAPLVTSVAVDLSGSGFEVCRPECKQSYDLCMSQYYRNPAKVPKCLESVCCKYENNCPNCGYCGTLNVDVNTRDEAFIDSVEGVSVADDNDDVHTTAECLSGMHRCSPDGSKIWKCSIFGPGYHWAFDKACRAGCPCVLGDGQTPKCSC